MARLARRVGIVARARFGTRNNDAGIESGPLLESGLSRIHDAYACAILTLWIISSSLGWLVFGMEKDLLVWSLIKKPK